jgi:hypothetical protein
MGSYDLEWEVIGERGDDVVIEFNLTNASTYNSAKPDPAKVNAKAYGNNSAGKRTGRLRRRIVDTAVSQVAGDLHEWECSQGPGHLASSARPVGEAERHPQANLGSVPLVIATAGETCHAGVHGG